MSVRQAFEDVAVGTRGEFEEAIADIEDNPVDTVREAINRGVLEEAGSNTFGSLYELSAAETTVEEAELETSRLPGTNSVNLLEPRNPGAEDNQSYEEYRASIAKNRAEEFVKEYPNLANLPVTLEPGTSLREDIVREVTRTEWVHPDPNVRTKEEGQETGIPGFEVSQLQRHEIPTWAQLIYWFVENRQAYDDGVYGHFRDNLEDENFHMKFTDSWTNEYGEKQAAKNAGALRQLAGGDYPDDSPAKSGESESGAWDTTATVMVTLTASSRPAHLQDRGTSNAVLGVSENGRLAPIDHMNSIRDNWSFVYNTVRNIMEFDFGLNSDEWGYIRGSEPHPGENDGVNAGYSHMHTGFFFDFEAAEFDGSEFELEAIFMRAVNKYVENNEYAEKAAHGHDKAVEASIGGLGKPAAYVSKYLMLGEEKDMKDMPIEYVAWSSIVSATGRQRIARSQLFTEAAKADRCKQSADHVHGSDVKLENGTLVCAHCGSSYEIEESTLTEARTSDSQQAIADGGQIVIELEEDGDWPDIDYSPDRYEFEGIETADGYREINHPGGGVSFVDYRHPVLELLRKTRLRYCGTVAKVRIVVRLGDEKHKTQNPVIAARWLVDSGIENPWHAEQLLEFDNWGRGLPEEFKSAVTPPPD